MSAGFEHGLRQDRAGCSNFTIFGTALKLSQPSTTNDTDVSGKTQTLTYNSVGQVTQIITSKGTNSETTKFTYHRQTAAKTKGTPEHPAHQSGQPAALVTFQVHL